MSEIEIQNKLKELRKEHELSQEELAEALGVSRQSVIALEQGKYMPSLPLAVSMCQFFKTAFEEIFEFECQIDEEIDKIMENHSNFSDNNIKIKVINNPSVSVGASPSTELSSSLSDLGVEDGARKEANMPLELEPWRPFREAVSLRDAMDRLLEDSVVTPVKGITMPKIDIKEKKDSVVVKAELPGVVEDQVEVEITDNVMTISGEKAEEKEEEKEGYYYKESHSGSFSRSFALPSEVAAEKADADMKNGVLTVTIPKVEAKKPKKVTIKKKEK